MAEQQRLNPWASKWKETAHKQAGLGIKITSCNSKKDDHKTVEQLFLILILLVRHTIHQVWAKKNENYCM